MNGHESAGSHVVTAVLCAAADETAGAARARLTREKPANVEIALVLAADGRLAGVVPMAKLLAAEASAPLAQLADPEFPRVRADLDQEHAASLALHHRVDAVPVVDADGRPLGVMPAQALLQVLRREHVEDLHRLAGIQRETARARHAIEDPPLRRAWHRLPWLVVGLAGAMLATAAMGMFEASMQAKVAVAFFVPAIVYLADAMGTQSETVAVRGLSLTRAGIGHLLGGELATGMLLGAALGALAYFPVLWWLEEPPLAAAVAVSVFAAGSVASALGLLVPWLIARLGVDPAYGSGPAATVLQDITSILVYFVVLRAAGV